MRKVRDVCVGLWMVVLCFLHPVQMRAQSELHNSIFSKPFEYARVDTDSILHLIDKAGAIRTQSPDSAMVLLYRAMNYSLQLGYSPGIATSFLGLGLCKTDKGDYDGGAALMQQAWPYIQQTVGEKGRRLHVLYNLNMAVPYGTQGNYEASLLYLFRAIDAMKQNNINDSSLLINIYQDIGVIFIKDKDYDKGLVYTRIADKIAQKTTFRGSEDFQVIKNYIYINYATIYQDKNMPDSSMLYCKKVLASCKQHHDPVNEQDAYTILAYLQDSLSDAVFYLKRALKCDTYHPSVLYLGLGKAYYKMGEYKQAELYLRLALNVAQSSGTKTATIADTHQLLSELYAKTGHYSSAYKQQKEYIDLNDSLTNIDRQTAINQLEVKYRTSEKDRNLISNKLLISQQQMKITHNRLLIILTSVGSLLLAIVTLLLLVLYRNNRHKQQLQGKQIQILQQEQQIVKLNALMEGEEKERARLGRELHDGIGGMLASVRLNLGSIKDKHPEVGHIKKLDDIMDMLKDVSTEVRKTAHNLMPAILVEHTLEEAILIYCNNINESGEVNIDLQFNVDPKQLNKAVELMLYRITQELIQNIIKHANATYAVIQIMQKQERLCIIVEDNGTGFDINEINNGYGLQNMQFRVQALEGYISIMSAKGKSTTIHIEFDLQKLNTTSYV